MLPYISEGDATLILCGWSSTMQGMAHTTLVLKYWRSS